jgi:hypothetical protein
MRHPVATSASALLLLLAGCGNQATRATPPRLLPASLGSCPHTHVDGPEAGEFISQPGAWVKIDAIEAGGVDRTTREFRGAYAVVGGDEDMVAALGPTPTSLRIHGPTATAAAEALALGATVHAHTGARDDARYVAFALAVKGDEFAFLGECQDRLLTQPMARRLGPDAAGRLTRLVGADAAALRRALVVVPPPASGPPLLNPEITPPDVLAKLHTGLFSLTPPPDSWRGAHTICTHIAAGWADCVDLSTPETAKIKVNYYVDPADPTVEVWVLDSGADVARPLARLATLDLAALAEQARLDAGKPGIDITLTLRSSPSLAEVVADPERAGGAVARVAVSRD